MDIIKLLKDYNIQYYEHGKNISGGWIGLQCPFCGDHSTHLGYNVSQDYGFSCWRCGYHSVVSTMSTLTGLSFRKMKQITKEYEGKSHKNVKRVEPRKKSLKFPSNTTGLKNIHKRYLKKRNFDPDYLEQNWDLRGTGFVSHLDNIDLKFRIIIPIYWNEKIISWQSRDVTNNANIRYITCPEEREIIHHKDIVYGKQEHWKDTGILVEGVTDVWRLGFNSFCTFGTQTKNSQIRLIASKFKHVVIIFDQEYSAQKRAKKIASELKFRGVSSEIIKLNNDPADLSQSEANKLINKIYNYGRTKSNT